MMDKLNAVKQITEARARIACAMQGLDLPQIEAMLRNADMELHWALWNLGEPVALRPEIEYAEHAARS